METEETSGDDKTTPPPGGEEKEVKPVDGEQEKPTEWVHYQLITYLYSIMFKYIWLKLPPSWL